jgi:hypothetical protein
MSEHIHVERFKRSHFWRMGKEFRAADIASFCELPTQRARQVLSEMKEEVVSLGGAYYKRASPNSNILRMRWNNPVSDEYTPRYY